MAHQVNGVDYPLAGQSQEGAPGAPWLWTFAKDAQLILCRNLDNAWKSVARTEPSIAKSVFVRDPRHGDFKLTDLPALFVWHETDSGPRQVAVSRTIQDLDVHLAWIPPPAQGTKLSLRDQFWASVGAQLGLYASDQWLSIHTTKTAWGKTLMENAGFERLQLAGGQPEELLIPPNTPVQTAHWVFQASMLITADNLVGAPVSPAHSCVTYLGGDDADLALFTSDLS